MSRGIAALVLAVGAAAQAGAPRVTEMMPNGGTPGSEVVVRLSGVRLAQALDVVCYRPGVRLVTIANPTVNDRPAGDRCEVTLAIAADCPLGAHALRLRTAGGLSNLLQLHVGPLPCVAQERGDRPQVIPLGCTVDGELRAGTADRYRVVVAAGARVVCEVESMRLGRATDLALAIHDPTGRELAAADDTALGRRDPWCAFTAPEAGGYDVVVRAAVAADRSAGAYRLHVGTFPRPVGALPCGGAPGATLTAELVGEVPAGTRATITLPLDGGDRFAWFPSVGGAVPPTPIWLAVNGAASASELAATDSRLVVPGAVHGVVGAPEATAVFTLAAKKGTPVELRCIARALRSPLDPVLTVRAADGRVLAANDDAGGTDSALRFDPPADGHCRVEVRDLLRGGSPEHFFRLEAGPAGRAARVAMVVQRQEEAVVGVPRGGFGAAVLRVDGLDAGATLAVRDLPAGVTARLGPRVPGTNLVPLLLTAAADAALTHGLVGFARGPDHAVDFVQPVTLVAGRNDFPQLQTELRALAVAVTEPAPFAVAATRPPVGIVRGGPLRIALTLERREGFTGRVRLRAAWLPPGISAGQATFDEKVTTAALPIDAAPGAALGDFPLLLVAGTRAGSAPLTAAMPFVDLSVVEPAIHAEIGTARTAAGATVELPITLKALREPDASGRATLLGLPRGVTAEPVAFAARATRAGFTLRVGADAPRGRHRDLRLEVALAAVGGELVHRFAGGELRIDEPAAVSSPAAGDGAAAGGGR